MENGPFSLDGRVALVTGAARGIGRVIAASMIEAGAKVARSDVLPYDEWESLSETEVRSASEHKVQICSAASCHRLVEEVVDHYNHLDLLVNSAGVTARGLAATMSEDDWQRVIDVNLTGTFLMCQAAFPALRDAKGAVVNLGSTNGHVAVRNSASYAVSKAGVMQLSRVLALEWATDGVRVNSVAPTIVPTAMTEDLRSDPIYMAEKMSSIPLGKMAEPSDVAHAIVFLLSSGAKMITGQTIFVDGGATIH